MMGDAQAEMAPRPKFVIQPKPDAMVVTTNGAFYVPRATLKDQYGHVEHIVKDDGDHVLIAGRYDEGFRTTTHWSLDAITALFALTAKVEVTVSR